MKALTSRSFPAEAEPVPRSPHHPFPMTICRCTAAPRELAGGSLSTAITVALKRFVDLADGQQEGYDEITVKVGRGAGRK
jgi:hypothetical protein